jgi:hypothetical protein
MLALRRADVVAPPGIPDAAASAGGVSLRADIAVRHSGHH